MLGRMSWTAPQITRQGTPSVAGERQMLESWLDFHRQTLLSTCSGLTAEQLRQRSAPPSTMSLLGLVRHMTDVERGWFRRRIAGEDVDFIYSSEADPTGSSTTSGARTPNRISRPTSRKWSLPARPQRTGHWTGPSSTSAV